MPLVDRDWPRADVWLAQDHPDPDVLVVGVPSSKASLLPSRADLTPQAVRDRFGRFSTFHGEWGIDFSEIAVRDVGNLPVSELDMNLMPDMVRRLASDLPAVPLVLYLGGDNAITRPLVNAHASDIGRIGLLTFDAHHDVRALDNGPSNGTPIRGLIDEDGLPGARVTQVGIHSFANSSAYRSYCDDVGISIFTMDDIEQTGIVDVVDGALAALASSCEVIYVDVDIDVLDVVFAPACPGARPGGMTVRQLAEGVRVCARHPKVVAMDFVEVDADSDLGHVTLDAMTHLVLSAIAGFAER